MLLKNTHEITEQNDIQHLDFFLYEYGNKYPMYTIAIYENSKDVFLLNSKIMPWYMNNIFYEKFTREEKYRHYRFDDYNTEEIYRQKKQQVLQNYRTYNTNLIDILYYLLQKEHIVNCYSFYIESFYSKYYIELFNYVLNSNIYAPIWLYDINFIQHLTGQRHNLTQENLRHCFLSRKLRNMIRNSERNNLSSEQIIYLNSFADIDNAEIINNTWFKWLW
jgi:hypothetical protein